MSARSILKLLLSASLLLTLTGCSYYKVTDRTTGRSYYSRWVERNTTTLMVNFRDANTGADKTLAATDIERISRSEFKRAVKHDLTFNY